MILRAGGYLVLLTKFEGGNSVAKRKLRRYLKETYISRGAGNPGWTGCLLEKWKNCQILRHKPARKSRKSPAKSRILSTLELLIKPRKSKDQTLPIGSRESFTWIILKTILCLVLDTQGKPKPIEQTRIPFSVNSRLFKKVDYQKDFSNPSVWRTMVRWEFPSNSVTKIKKRRRVSVPRNGGRSSKFIIYTYLYHPCMVYLPTFTHKNQPNVGKYTIHGWYGIYTLLKWYNRP